MEHRDGSALPVFGGSSLLVIFSVLCMTVFALLTLSTAQANARLNEASVNAVSCYYEADQRAEEIFALLRSGKEPENVTEENGIYSYACPITETQLLCVKVEKKDGTWTVLQWRAESAAEYQESEWNVWDGE